MFDFPAGFRTSVPGCLSSAEGSSCTLRRCRAQASKPELSADEELVFAGPAVAHYTRDLCPCAGFVRGPVAAEIGQTTVEQRRLQGQTLEDGPGLAARAPGPTVRSRQTVRSSGSFSGGLGAHSPRIKRGVCPPAGGRGERGAPQDKARGSGGRQPLQEPSRVPGCNVDCRPSCAQGRFLLCSWSRSPGGPGGGSGRPFSLGGRGSWPGSGPDPVG